MTSRDTTRRATCGDFGRPEDELLATLLPVETPSEELPIAYAIPVSTRSPMSPTGIASYGHHVRHSWQPFGQEQLLQRPRLEEALVVPPPPNGNLYRDTYGGRLSLAQQQGLQASHEESRRIRQNNRRVDAYNNQIELDVYRANEVAQMENERERQLQNLAISSPPPPTSPSIASRTGGKQGSQKAAYFAPPKGGTGYQVKEYDIREDDGDYSYDIREYKSDYDGVE